VKNHLITRSV